MAASEQPVQTVGVAVDAFLARADLAVSSRRSYAQTLNRLAADVGAARALGALGTLDADALDTAVQRAWGACAPATWNRHVATARSFVAFFRRRGWLTADVAVGVDRRREPGGRLRARVPDPRRARRAPGLDVDRAADALHVPAVELAASRRDRMRTCVR